MSEKFVLVIPSHDAALSEYIKVFKRKLDLSPIFYLGYSSNLVEKVTDGGFICIKQTSNASKLPPIQKTFFSILKKFMDKTVIGCFLQKNILLDTLVRKKIDAIKRKSSELEGVINQYGISTCLLATDRSSGIEASVYLLAKKTGLKTIVLSFATAADFISSYKLREAQIYKNQKKSISKNVYTHEDLGSRAFFRPFEESALIKLGIFPDNPWVLGSGCCDYMLLESNREKERLIRLGGNKHKYIITGSASHDDLYHSLAKKKSLSEALIKKFQLPYEKNIIVSLPQYYEHGLCEKKAHFQYIDGLLHQLCELKFNVLITLHPKMKLEDYIHLKNRFPVTILEESLSDVIVVADIFLATYSSTVAWALMCRIPIVMFDHINLNYSDFYSEFELTVVKDNKNLKAEVINTINTTVAHNSEYQAKKLSPFDGNCVDRIVRLLSAGVE